MLYQVYDWVTWKVIINRTTWLNTNDVITWHRCLGKEPVLLQCSPANQTPLYSIAVNSAISAENVGDCSTSTAGSPVPPLPAQPLGGRRAILARLHPPAHPAEAGTPAHPCPGFAAWGGSIHISLLPLLLDGGFTGNSGRPFLCPFSVSRWSSAGWKTRMSLFCHLDWKGKWCPAHAASTGQQRQELKPVLRKTPPDLFSVDSFQFKEL